MASLTDDLARDKGKKKGEKKDHFFMKAWYYTQYHLQ